MTVTMPDFQDEYVKSRKQYFIHVVLLNSYNVLAWMYLRPKTPFLVIAGTTHYMFLGFVLFF